MGDEKITHWKKVGSVRALFLDQLWRLNVYGGMKITLHLNKHVEEVEIFINDFGKPRIEEKKSPIVKFKEEVVVTEKSLKNGEGIFMDKERTFTEYVKQVVVDLLNKGTVFSSKEVQQLVPGHYFESQKSPASVMVGGVLMVLKNKGIIESVGRGMWQKLDEGK